VIGIKTASASALSSKAVAGSRLRARREGTSQMSSPEDEMKSTCAA
jgi:hypothetical protein